MSHKKLFVRDVVMRRLSELLLVASILTLPQASRAQNILPDDGSASVPRMVRHSGTVNLGRGPLANRMLGITFALYTEQEGGSPLWLETQNVAVDAYGHYTVELGSTRSTGLPAELFTSGEARWLGVQINGGEAQPRVLLLSVPYALKAADAETIGGLPASAFVLATPGTVGNATSLPPAVAATSTSQGSPSVGGSGTQNYVPLWTDNNGTLGNSMLYQLGSGTTAKLGVNITHPLSTLDVNGTTLIRGTLEPITKGVATAGKGYNSNPLDFEASSFNSTIGQAVMQHFEWQAEPTGNNTSSPGATLNMLFAQGNATPAETGLKLSNTGIFTFASGQTFPGTVTSVGLSAPNSDFTVTGSPVKGNGTLGLSWVVAPSAANNANAIVKRDANGSFSAGAITSSLGVSAVTGGISNGVYGENTSGFGAGVIGIASGGAGQGVWGESFGAGNYQNALPDGVHGVAHGQYGFGVSAINVSPGGSAIYASGGNGASSSSEGGTGVLAYGGSSTGGSALGGTGVSAVAGDGDYTGGTGGMFAGGAGGWNPGFGIFVVAGSGKAYQPVAGWFEGDVAVSGYLSKSSGSFKIDHPLDPANKYLYHSFVESPDMLNIYNGNAILDGNGEALISLPDWFETLNRDFRYQLTSIGGFAPVYVAQKVQNNAFKIAGGKAGMEVSWQVTGIRQDAWANAHRIPVEESKPPQERGFYIHPELYGAPEEKGIAWARDPLKMQQLKKRRALVANRTAVAK